MADTDLSTFIAFMLSFAIIFSSFDHTGDNAVSINTDYVCCLADYGNYLLICSTVAVSNI